MSKRKEPIKMIVRNEKKKNDKCKNDKETFETTTIISIDE
jgi:hypothetical protein